MTVNNHATAEPETVDIETVQGLAELVSEWHTNRIQRLEHFLTVPEGIEFKIGEGEPKILEGPLYEGFLLGMTMALNEFQSLPFFAQAPADAQH